MLRELGITQIIGLIISTIGVIVPKSRFNKQLAQIPMMRLTIPILNYNTNGRHYDANYRLYNTDTSAKA